MRRYRLLMDPVHGEFVMVERGSFLEKIMDSVFVQRLRHIKQLGPCFYVYPGAEHTRFQHSVGTMWLARKALSYLRMKGYSVDEDVENAILISALIHDVGHSPYSHALEGVILPENHEELTLAILDDICASAETGRELALQVRKILEKKHEKPYTFQLISSQLDCDRLDYLKRDAFYTGVSFGLVDVNRILMSIMIEEDQLAWDHKSLNALEAYIMSRYQMYWAVYFHKTNLSVQVLLKKIVERIRELLLNGEKLPIDPLFKRVLKYKKLDDFFLITDANVTSSVYALLDERDPVVSDLSRRLVKRNFFKTVQVKPSEVLEYRDRVVSAGYDPKYYFEIIEPSKSAYTYYSPLGEDVIKVWKEGKIEEISNATPTDAVRALSRKVTKIYVTVPEDVLDA